MYLQQRIVSRPRSVRPKRTMIDSSPDRHEMCEREVACGMMRMSQCCVSLFRISAAFTSESTTVQALSLNEPQVLRASDTSFEVLLALAELASVSSAEAGCHNRAACV